MEYTWQVVAQGDGEAIKNATPSQSSLPPGTPVRVEIGGVPAIFGSMFDLWGAEVIGDYLAPSHVSVNDVSWAGPWWPWDTGKIVIEGTVTGSPVPPMLLGIAAIIIAIGIGVGTVLFFAYLPETTQTVTRELNKGLLISVIGGGLLLIGYGMTPQGKRKA